MFDGGDPVAAPHLDAFVADFGDFVRYIGPKTRLALRASIFILQWAPLFVLGRFARFTSLSREDRSRFLHKAERDRLALVVQGLKTIFAILWFDLHTNDLPALERREPRAGVAHAATRRKA